MLLLCFPLSVGDHGYNNSLPSMHPFLAAAGPSFRQGYQISNLQSLDIYPLMCHLLSITPLPNNGTLTKARCLLAAENCGVAPLVIGLVVGVLLLLTTITGKLERLQRYINVLCRCIITPQLREPWEEEASQNTPEIHGPLCQRSSWQLKWITSLVITRAVQKPDWNFSKIWLLVK